MNINEKSISAEKRHYYSSSQGPFHNANNILMFYGGGGRAEIAETVIRSLRVGDNIITVCGERGSGKTMMSLVLADRLKHRYNNIRYDLQQLSAGLMLRHLLIEICPAKADVITADQAELGAPADAIANAMKCLTRALLSAAPGNKPYMLIVDSSADLDIATMQLLSDLAAIEYNNEPALQIVFFRRTEANHHAAHQHGKSVPAEQAVSFGAVEDHYVLRRLSLAEIGEYLQHHMLLFDFNQRDVFTREMAYFIADRSEGVFRSINTLARNAFMVAGLEDAERLSMSHLLTAGLPAPEPQPEAHGFLWRHRSTCVGLLGFGVVAGLAFAIALGQ